MQPHVGSDNSNLVQHDQTESYLIIRKYKVTIQQFFCTDVFLSLRSLNICCNCWSDLTYESMMKITALS